MTLIRSMPFAANRQRGAILVTSLLLLITLTVVGVSVMQLTRLQERAAGNTRDLNLAFQGAEAALRQSEDALAAVAANVPICGAPPCAAGRAVVADALPVDLGAQTAAWWDANSTEYGIPGDQELPNLAQDPQVLVEQLEVGQFDLSGDPPIREFFQVTARSTGGSGDTNVVLQTTFARAAN